MEDKSKWLYRVLKPLGTRNKNHTIHRENHTKKLLHFHKLHEHKTHKSSFETELLADQCQKACQPFRSGWSDPQCWPGWVSAGVAVLNGLRLTPGGQHAITCMFFHTLPRGICKCQEVNLPKGISSHGGIEDKSW